MITAMIVDDEAACIQSLSRDLSAFADIKIIATSTSSEKAKGSIIKLQPDLLFLDVEMPQKNGIQLLQEIRQEVHATLWVVFYSAYDRYLIDALRTSAFDYLLKPYQMKELELIIERVKTLLSTHSQNFEQSMRRLLSDDRKFALQTLTGLLLLKRSDVIYFQFLNESRCWQMMLSDGTCHKMRSTITAKDLLNISGSFAQIGQDCILNIDYLISIENGNLKCIFYPPFQNLDITVSRRYYARLKELLEII